MESSQTNCNEMKSKLFDPTSVSDLLNGHALFSQPSDDHTNNSNRSLLANSQQPFQSTCIQQAADRPIDSSSSLVGAGGVGVGSGLLLLADIKPIDEMPNSGSLTTTPMDINSSPATVSINAPLTSANTNGVHNNPFTSVTNNGTGFLTRNKMSIDSNLNRLQQNTSFHNLAGAKTCSNNNIHAGTLDFCHIFN